jgi:hypothetical protein
MSLSSPQHPGSPQSNASDSMHQLLAVSMDLESHSGLFGTPGTPGTPDRHAPQQQQQQQQQHPQQAVGSRSADAMLKRIQDEMAREAVREKQDEEKKMEGEAPAVVYTVNSLDEAEAPHSTSFERAIADIVNEFDHDDDDGSAVLSPNSQTSPSHISAASLRALEGAWGSHELTASSPTASAVTSPPPSATSLESRRYNDILGLLRNRRQELTAALQRQSPATVLSNEAEPDATTAVTTVVSASEEAGAAVLPSPAAVAEPTPRGDEAEAFFETMMESVGQEEEEQTAEENLDEGVKAVAAESRTKAMETRDTAVVKEELGQHNETPPPRRQVELPAPLSATPPRSPKRSLPYFHKPSGTTPPTFWLEEKVPKTSPSPSKARPNFSPQARRQPSPKARPDFSPRRRATATTRPASPGASAKSEASKFVAESDPGTKPLPDLTRTMNRPPQESPKSDVAGAPSPFRISPSLSAYTPRGSPMAGQATIQRAATNLSSLPKSPRKASSSSSVGPGSSSRGGASGSNSKHMAPDKIRFRDPYPILRPERQPREATEIMADHMLPKDLPPLRWAKPKADLKQLIVSAMGPSLTRRSNACGALKVLTQSKKNQINLFRTDSFMASLIFCASQDITAREQDVALDARTRAIFCIKAVCQPKLNRYHIVTFPGFLDTIIKVIRNDNGESRCLACGALALIGKTSDCREAIGKDMRVVKLLAQVLGNRAPAPPLPVPDKELSRASPDSQLQREDTYEEDEDDESAVTDGNESAFAGALSLDFDSFSLASRPNLQRPHLASSDEEDGSGSDSETDHAPLDSIRKKKAEQNQAFREESRANVCAVLLHLSRECVLSVGWTLF